MSKNSFKDSPVQLALALIGLLGAVLLIVSLFLDWYKLSGGGETISLGGWGSLEFGDMLFVLIFAGTVTALLRGRRASSFLMGGALALVFVVIASTTKAPIVELITASGTDADASLEVGVFVAAGGAVLLLIAGGLGLAIKAEAQPAEDRHSPST